MRARFRSWWRQIKTHPYIVVGFIVVLFAIVALVAFIFAAYRFGWSGTGFLNKTLWDWLQLLIIPLVLAVAALLFNRATTRSEQNIALDKQREDLLQTYLDCLSELLLEKGLATKPIEEARDARNLARVRTITILCQLDARRIGYVFAFLREAGLMSNQPNSSIVSLSRADLRKINFSRAMLRNADLSRANLREADLREAVLLEANLSHADLRHAILTRANMFGADLSYATLLSAELTGAALYSANLSHAVLSDTNLREVDLREANLSLAELNGADLSHAKLFDADLSRANLKNASVTQEQLKTAKSLQGAIMPDGFIHP